MSCRCMLLVVNSPCFA
uniref:Uncharacterized protein n=1 Tax=Rhizophora mucronata TaxID=61149 RepID=A0A2P2N679_RHIMU